MVNVVDLEVLFVVGEEVNFDFLCEKLFVKYCYDVFKIFGDGEFMKGFMVNVY